MITTYPELRSFPTEHMHAILYEIEAITTALKAGYKTPYGALYAPRDQEAIRTVTVAAQKIMTLNPTLFLLVGIGGSTMGALAIIQALLGSYQAFSGNARPRFFCADTIDNDYQRSLLAIVEQELQSGGNVVLCIVTKSGTTAETLINGSLFLELIKKYTSDYEKYLVFITDKNSPLWNMSGGTCIEIPKPIGGRFSVFTAVSLFPLVCMGIEIESLCKGAATALNECLNKDLESNDAACSASLLYKYYHQGYEIHDLFVFSPDLYNIAGWYKQLIGESLGKKYDIRGTLVEVGITPTISIGTTDLHSVAQLYLAGPRTRVTSFITLEEQGVPLYVPRNNISTLVPGLAERSIPFVQDAILKGVMAAYEKEERPFMHVRLKKSSFSLGAFMMNKIVETLFLARLFEINPFDQPAVELYKEETRKILN